jgi:glycosyltransferase involved in cell wall biosynthesis
MGNMNSPQQLRILHLTDSNRGGSQRYIVDLCRSVNPGLRHFILRVAPDVIGLHDVTGNRLLALDRAELRDGWPALLRASVDELGIGCIHAHALAPLLEAIDAESTADFAHLIVTLHDLRAIDPQFFNSHSIAPAADPQWVARCNETLQRAAALIVPSEWMADVVRTHYPNASPRVVENGIAADPALELDITPPWPASKQVYAVVGAVGAHKGKETLMHVAAAIGDPDVVGVVIGYTEDDSAGWAVPGKLFVHGRYQPAELAGLLSAYHCRIVYFPNIVPESFSYVLSEVWQAGIPAVVPKVGALGMRVERSRAGWLLDDPLDFRRAAALIAELLGPAGAAQVAAAKAALTAHPQAVADVDSMRSQIERIYEAIGMRSATDAAAGWTRLATRFRDARFRDADDSLLDAQWPMLLPEAQRLRAWNAKLVADIAAIESSARRMQVHFAESVARAKALDDDVRELKARNETIEADAATLRAYCDRLEGGIRNQEFDPELGSIRARNAALEQHVVALRKRNLRVEEDVNTLVARNAQLEGDVVALTQRYIELDADVVALKERNLLVESGLASVKERNARVESDAATLHAELVATRARRSELERALSILPASLQNWLLRNAR